MEFLDGPTPNNPVSTTIKVRKFFPNKVQTSPRQNQKHVTVCHLRHQPRWGNKSGDRATIESKPWYMRSFAEVVELECGEELREERYGKYNKSFVTKVPTSGNKLTFAFNSVVSKQPNTTRQFQSRGNNTTVRATNEMKTIENSIQARRLKAGVMDKQISEVDRKLREATCKINEDINDINHLKDQMVRSEVDLLDLQRRSARAAAVTQSAVQSLVSNRQKPMENHILEWNVAFLNKVRTQNMDELECRLIKIQSEEGNGQSFNQQLD